MPHTEHVESCRSDEIAKRGRDDAPDFEDVSGVTNSSPNAKLCGACGAMRFLDEEDEELRVF